jgi:hypothetical protein
MMVVQTNDASFFQVEPVDGIDPARLGVGVKRTKEWLRAQHRQAQTLVRKAASVVVQTAWDGNQLDP